MSAAALRRVAAAALLGLIVLCAAWELWLAPLRPGGSWLALKMLPLVAAAPGVLKGRSYTFKWAMMLVLAYFVEGAVRAWSERGLSAALALAEIVFALVFYITAILYVRATRASPR